ncbi:hypothetical protein BD289DRAFT_423208 [Coniella lustricola]|uniref:Uncharacterized protein n=1 Tax=Coniella lustricola TaxID=2025994 RepID=A0A2T3AJJ6_9PEZI|nr:hypothetical protein BD289DRAFT_423208 [Coniella lustricola]
MEQHQSSTLQNRFSDMFISSSSSTKNTAPRHRVRRLALLRMIVLDIARLYVPFAFSALCLTFFGVLVATAGKLTTAWIAIYSTFTFSLIFLFVACLSVLRCCLRVEKREAGDDDSCGLRVGEVDDETVPRTATPRTAAGFMNDPRLVQNPGLAMDIPRNIEMRGIAAQRERGSKGFQQVSHRIGC